MSATRDQFSFSDLVHLANTPGPMQGMAQSMLLRVADQTAAEDNASEKLGRSPASGPGGLNFDSPRPGHTQYPQELLDSLVARYGTQGAAPSGDNESPHVAPAQPAIKAYTDEMESYEPSLWDKIKSLGSAVINHPRILADAGHDMAEYATPVFAQYRGTQDFGRDKDELMADPADPLTKMMRYGPALTLDALQSFSPIGLSARGAGRGLSDVLARYGAAAPHAAWQSVLQNFMR